MDPLENTVSDVLAATGRQSPELGGGAASVLAGLIGLALVRMAIATTDGKANEDLSEKLKHVDGLNRRLEDVARSDVAAFRDYVSALRLPHETQRDDQQRDEALNDSGHRAAEIPLLAAGLIADGLQSAADAAGLVRAEVASDIYAGAAILNGAFIGAIATLDINLKPRRIAGEKERLEQDRQVVMERRAQAMRTLGEQARRQGYSLDGAPA